MDTYYEPMFKEEVTYENPNSEIISFSYVADYDKNIDESF